MTEMRVDRVHFPGQWPIEGYGPDFFRVGGEVHRGMILVLPGGVAAWKGFSDIQNICNANEALDLLVVGTGQESVQPPDTFRQGLLQYGIEVEVMTTPSACRTFNVLLSEGRRVAVALMPV